MIEAMKPLFFISVTQFRIQNLEKKIYSVKLFKVFIIKKFEIISYPSNYIRYVNASISIAATVGWDNIALLYTNRLNMIG